MTMFSGVNDASFGLVRKMAQEAVKDMVQAFSHVFDVVYFESDYQLVPATGKQIYAAFAEAFNGGPLMQILKTPADCQCFLGVDGNDIYRVIHDYDHYIAYTEGFGTTKLADEAALNRRMVNRILGNIGGPIDSGLRRAIGLCLLADLVGQSYYYAQHKNFIGNKKQLDFVVWLVSELDRLDIGVADADHEKWSSIVFPDFS